MDADEFDSMHVHLMIPIVSEEARELLREHADAALEDVDDPNLRAFVDYIRFRTLGDALDATPVDAYAMHYTGKLLLGFMDYLVEQSGFYEEVTEEDGTVSIQQISPDNPATPRGLKLVYEFDQANPDATTEEYLAWRHSLSDADNRAVCEDLNRLHNLQEWCAALSAASQRLLIAIRDTVQP